jgi:hypothetical protein
LSELIKTNPQIKYPDLISPGDKVIIPKKPSLTVKLNITKLKNVSGSAILKGSFGKLQIEGSLSSMSFGKNIIKAEILNLSSNIQWYHGDIKWGLEVPDLGKSISLNDTRAELFFIYDTPINVYKPKGVWTEALRFLCHKAKVIGLSNTSEIMKTITQYCHGSSHGLKYDTMVWRISLWSELERRTFQTGKLSWKSIARC